MTSQQKFLIASELEKYCDSSDIHDPCLRFQDINIRDRFKIDFKNGEGDSFELRYNEFEDKYSYNLHKKVEFNFHVGTLAGDAVLLGLAIAGGLLSKVAAGKKMVSSMRLLTALIFMER